MKVAYLCSVGLNPLRRGAQNLLSNPQRMHAAVEGIIPPQRSGRILWRLERTPHRCELLVLSPDVPSLDHLVEQAGWPGNTQAAPRVADMSPLLSKLAIGRQFEFRVTVNPASTTRTLTNASKNQASKLDQSPRSIRVGHRTVNHQLAWFTSRTTGVSPQWGFTTGKTEETAEVRVVGREYLRFSRARQIASVSLDVATFQGRLTITNVDDFTRALLSGIGKAKAYGCGLLTVAPVGNGHVVEG